MENNDNKQLKKSSLFKSEDIKDVNEILEIEKLSRIMENFSFATGLTTAIVNHKGNILYDVGGKSICMDFHRKHKISSERCFISDSILANQLIENEKHSIHVCQNGMVDIATPIIIAGVHVANLFIGQFFFETPNKDFFIKQAEKLDFDKVKYMKALEECNVYNKETIFRYLDFLSGLINMISELAQKTIELKKQNEEIAFISYHDYLTGLYNRSYFEEEKKRLDTPRQLPISVIMGDINGLKVINEGFGHSKGDEMIIEIARILKSSCRAEDIISRIGEDQFAILLPKTDEKSAQLICRRIHNACEVDALNDSLIYPSISLGCATKNFETEIMDDILIAAEESMYKQKLLESKSAHSSIIASIKVIMFEKSQETEEHAERIVQLSKDIGQAMSLTKDQLNDLELLSTLHDIGKMGVSPKILSKPGKLNNDDWIEMRKHPEVGYRIARATSELLPIADCILCHHERWDGKGYPQGLIGEEIPILSRIVAIADSYDAMTNDRVYRSAMTNEEAIEEMRRNSGTQFDPDILQLFLNMS
ncbi:MAG: hypothetical protein FD141_661 [Fusobacteria bacterium]|nr:MAG: hypothetical protein FD141_661 [Fusobacteriota bacterium]KAF0228673.1 MAG: hypothetical protein FD182_929 [Fusobacteriota bacterium]